MASATPAPSGARQAAEPAQATASGATSPASISTTPDNNAAPATPNTSPRSPIQARTPERPRTAIIHTVTTAPMPSRLAAANTRWTSRQRASAAATPRICSSVVPEGPGWMSVPAKTMNNRGKPTRQAAPNHRHERPTVGYPPADWSGRRSRPNSRSMSASVMGRWPYTVQA